MAHDEAVEEDASEAKAEDAIDTVYICQRFWPRHLFVQLNTMVLVLSSGTPLHSMPHPRSRAFREMKSEH